MKSSKDRFDRLKVVCITKIDVLAASRSNMFSNLLVMYERSLSEFTEKCANTFTVIANSFKGKTTKIDIIVSFCYHWATPIRFETIGYQSYDFCVVKELSDLKPGSSIAQQVNDCNDDKWVALLDTGKQKQLQLDNL